MSATSAKYDKFMEELPKNKYNLTKTALASGFAKSTAETQQGRIYKSALKHKAKQIVAQLEGQKAVTKEEGKRLMTDIIGLSKEKVFERLAFIATQERDLGSALKVLAPLASEHNVNISGSDDQKVTVPILNVTVKENTPLIETAQPSPLQPQ